jgi:D-sedoheptulose 7-phosphate isomerase
MLEDLREHQQVFVNLEQLLPQASHAAWFIYQSLKAGGKIMLCGNGGSAADAQHLAAEFVGRFRADRAPLPALALTADSATTTAIGNDFGFDQVFARQVSAFGRMGDVLIAISTSGNSPNVVAALLAARRLGVTTIGLLGKDGGACAALCNVPIIVASTSTARVQEAHIFLGHAMCAQVEQWLA